MGFKFLLDLLHLGNSCGILAEKGRHLDLAIPWARENMYIDFCAYHSRFFAMAILATFIGHIDFSNMQRAFLSIIGRDPSVSKSNRLHSVFFAVNCGIFLKFL